MKVILLLFYFPISFTKARVAYMTDECQALTDLRTDADSCCTLPRPAYSPENEVICRDECSKHLRRRCCIKRCRIARLGIWKNETFHKEALRDIMLGGDAETKGIWGQTVKDAVDVCSERFLTSSYDTQISCIPSFVQYIYFCVNAELFINCPRMLTSYECTRVRTKVIECTKSDPQFQFPAYYYKWRFSVKKSRIQNRKGENNEIEENNGEED